MLMEESMRSKELDQFYTKKDVAEECVNFLTKFVDLRDKVVLEPSAGEGVFSDILRDKEVETLAIDVDPKKDYIKKMCYLSGSFNVGVVVGNPPFGKNSSMAVKFFNKAAVEADYIGFILPRTFEKEFFQNKLNRSMHLVGAMELDKGSFTHNGLSYEVPCVFQVWEKRDEDRELYSVNNVWFEVVKEEDAEYAIRRVGGRSGEVLDKNGLNKSSVLYVKDLKEGVKDFLISSYNDLNLLAERTSGMKSISSKEIAKYIKDNF